MKKHDKSNDNEWMDRKNISYDMNTEHVWNNDYK